MKKSIRALSVAMALAFLLSPSALADLARGDRGEAVADLQRMLWETGFLFEEPDGVFGRNTEQAVKDYESYAYLPVDGIADDQMLYELSVTHSALNEVVDADAYDNIDFSFYQGNGGMGNEQTPHTLNASVIIDTDQIYYSGILNGEEGIFAMNPDGSNPRRISDMKAVLKAASDGNLLVWHYDYDGYGALEVLRSDGTLETVGYSNNYGIAAGGRFYFGGSSVAEDGYDHQWVLSSDPEYHDNYYPLVVFHGYLYYLDTNVVSGHLYGEDSMLPPGAAISRLELETGYIDPVTPIGTRYIGYDDGRIYYQLEDVYTYDENYEENTIEVDEGLYYVDLIELERTRLAGTGDGETVFDNYRLVKDGVVYGDRFSYQDNEDGSCSVVMVQGDGEMLSPVPLHPGERIEGFYAADGKYYGIGSIDYEDANGYYSVEALTEVDVYTGEIKVTELDKNEMLCYTDGLPQIAVLDGYMYFYVQNINDGSESLKVMDLDGGSIRTLIKSEPLY